MAAKTTARIDSIVCGSAIGIDSYDKPLDWETRVKIALGAARGLVYLHEDSNPRIIHRDFKASNILLDNDYTAKVSDFGLAKAAPDGEMDHISTRVMGTFGYGLAAVHAARLISPLSILNECVSSKACDVADTSFGSSALHLEDALIHIDDAVLQNFDSLPKRDCLVVSSPWS